MRRFADASANALILLLLMFAGGLGLWIGIPLAWLWIGSQVQVATGSLGAAVAAMMVGVVISILLMVPVLNWLSNKHRAIRLARGRDDIGHLALEIVLVGSATIALVAFGVWFFFFSGSSPIPLNLSY
ncbi:MAG: hypothetical protein NVSMB51_21370 [Solirubrobacteraceae bacterium]